LAIARATTTLILTLKTLSTKTRLAGSDHTAEGSENQSLLAQKAPNKMELYVTLFVRMVIPASVPSAGRTALLDSPIPALIALSHHLMEEELVMPFGTKVNVRSKTLKAVRNTVLFITPSAKTVSTMSVAVCALLIVSME